MKFLNTLLLLIIISITAIAYSNNINNAIVGKWSYNSKTFTEGFIFRADNTFSEIGPDGGEGRWKLKKDIIILNYDFIIYSKKNNKDIRHRYTLKLRVKLYDTNGKRILKLDKAIFYKIDD